MRYVTLLLLGAAPSVFSLPVAPSLPFVSDPSPVLLLLAGLVGVVMIRRRQQ